MIAARRIDVRAVPVGVEDVRELRNDGADDQRVHVDEIVGRAAHEVLVGDVAATGDDDHAVGDEELVVHPVVEALEVEQRRGELGQEPAAPAAERVEQPHLDVRERGEPDEQRVAAGRVEIVDEQAHAHAALRGVAHIAQQQVPGLVVVDMVVLQVERPRGAPGEFDPRVERIRAQWQQPEAGQSGFGQRRLRDAHERARRGGCQRGRRCGLPARRQRAATGKAEHGAARQHGARGEACAPQTRPAFP